MKVRHVVLGFLIVAVVAYLAVEFLSARFCAPTGLSCEIGLVE